MLNTCKSNGNRPFGVLTSGGRVSNTLVTYLEKGDNQWKHWLIPYRLDWIRRGQVKVFGSFQEGPAAYQLVGEVKAYQGNDG